MNETERPQRPKRKPQEQAEGVSKRRTERTPPRAQERPVKMSAETVAGASAYSTTFSPQAIAEVDAFAAEQPYPLDPFQVESARHLAEGRSVLVAAPTGTGKTVVAEFGIRQARLAGLRAIYTAPLKALSNQKFRDLRARYGEGEVGLLTGDIVENPRAPIVVMTTEIYRNMLLEGLRAAQISPAQEADALLHSVRMRKAVGDVDARVADDIAELARQSALDEELSTVGCVIFDELHYLSDPGRGPVWEEAIIHSPKSVRLIGLSATVSNADELRRWIESVHGPMALVFHTERAVPLEHYFYLDGELHLVQDATGRRRERFPDIGGEAKLARMRSRGRRFSAPGNAPEQPSMAGAMQRRIERAERSAYVPGRARQGSHGDEAALTQPGKQTTAHVATEASAAATQDAEPEQPKERAAPEPGETLTALREAGLLPCIYFLPGRRAVETAAESAKGHLLVSAEDRAALHDEVQAWVRSLPPEDQKLDQVQRLAALLPRGLAFHHAGLLPGLKVMVETFFQRGKLRAVFATDTLALGVNMPARSVVLGSLSKFDGTQMRLLTPNEYQQLTGRAGRRGMDAKGAAVLLYSQWDAFEPSFAALTAPLLPVMSAFTVRYNTVLNLWRPGDVARLRLALAASLREFQRRGGRAWQGAAQAAATEIEHGLAPPQGRRAKRAQREQPQGLSRAATAELNATIDVLRQLGYIDQDDELSIKGRLLRAMFHPAGMVITELLVGGALDDLNAAELAEVISWFTFDDDRQLRNFDHLSQHLTQVRREVYRAQGRVLETEYEEGVTLSPRITEDFHGVALNWSRGFTLGGLLRRIDLAEGDLLVTLNQTIDLLQQVQGALGQALDARDIWRDAGPETRRGRFLTDLRERLTRLRPLLDAAWRGMLRGSVAQSRAVPSMATPDPRAEQDADVGIPALPMAEDEDPDEARQDRVIMGDANEIESRDDDE